MKQAIKDGISYATVGCLCAILGAALSLRIYAGLPERVTRLETRLDATIKVNDEKWERHSEWSRDALSTINSQLGELKGMLRRMEQEHIVQR